MTITNSLIIYQEICQKKVSHLKFIEEIIKSLLGALKKKIEKTLVHYAVLINSEKKSGERQRCKLDTCEKLTMWKCMGCSTGKEEVYLCILCFKNYHK